MDKTASKKNTKWIIFGSVVFVLAVLIAVGPILLTKYMRAKWEKTPNYKATNLLMNISGQLNVSKDNIYYIKGDNGLFYVIENLKQDLADKVNERCSIICKFREAKNNETVDGNSVRLFIEVQKFIFQNDNNVENEDVLNEIKNIDENIDEDIDEEMDEYVYEKLKENEELKENEDLEQKYVKKAKLRVEINTRLDKPIFFDVIKGKVLVVNRKDRNNKEYKACVLTDEFNDNYMLYKKGKDLSSLENKEIIVLGREILPPLNMPLVVDETTFEIYEVYDIDLKKLF